MSRYFDVIGGIRFDHFDLDFTNQTGGQQLDRVDNVWSPRVGAVFKPLELSIVLRQLLEVVPAVLGGTVQLAQCTADANLAA